MPSHEVLHIFNNFTKILYHYFNIWDALRFVGGCVLANLYKNDHKISMTNNSSNLSFIPTFKGYVWRLLNMFHFWVKNSEVENVQSVSSYDNGKHIEQKVIKRLHVNCLYWSKQVMWTSPKSTWGSICFLYDSKY